MVKHFKIKKRESLEIITSRLIEYIFENFLLVPSIMKIDLRKISKKIGQSFNTILSRIINLIYAQNRSIKTKFYSMG